MRGADLRVPVRGRGVIATGVDYYLTRAGRHYASEGLFGQQQGAGDQHGRADHCSLRAAGLRGQIVKRIEIGKRRRILKVHINRPVLTLPPTHSAFAAGEKFV